MSNTRSLVAGTVGCNNYEVGRFHAGVYEQIDEARDKILSFVRPSADGNRIVFVARGFDPKLGLLEKK
jgi:hypothetical protein